jgi:C4-dicarboxylate-specific signal transduction histidine kinase
MALEKTYRRLPLRDLLTDAEKRSRDVVEHITNTWLAKVADLRDLSRPLRRKSHYPTLLALQNSLQRVVQLSGETDELLDYLERQLNEIRDHARRERLNRG